MLATASDENAVRGPVQDERGTRWLGDLGRDLRHAVRGLRRSPGFAASVALMLALGLGANTAMFSIVYGVLLRPLPYPNAAAIVRIGEPLGSSGGSDMWLSNRSIPLLDESAESFEQLAGYQEISARSASLDGATLSGARVSPSLFPLLRSRPQLGRLFTEGEAREGADRVVLLSQGVWTRRFGSDADIVGTLVDLDGEPHTVVGVLPDGFDFPNPANEFWTPLVVPPFAPPSTDDPAEPRTVVSLVFGGLGRLRPGVSPEQAAGGFRLLRSNRSRAVLVMAQVALALVLLIGTGLLLRSFVGLVTFDRGYDPANVVSTRAVFPFSSQPSMAPEAQRNSADRYGRLHERLLDEMAARLEPLPDVEAFGLSRSLPFERSRTSEMPLRMAGTPMPSDPNEMVRTKVRIVSPGHFEAMRFRLRGGRALTDLDGSESPRVLVANETLARELFGGGPAVGQRVVSPMSEPWEVVGVAGDVVYEGLELTAEPQAEAFFPLAQVAGERGFGWSSSILVTVRTTGDSLAVVPFLREAVTATDPQARIGSVVTMDARLSTAVAEPLFYAVFVGSFAGLALLLAALGIFGLLSYTVAQRQGEIGIRMALGARRGDILALVARQAAVLVAVGAATGMAGAAASSRVLESLLYGVATDDLLTFVAAPLVLVAVALVACWLPARQATRIAPIEALRVE